MQIAVFGAIGQQIVHNLLDAGHGVRAYARNPAKVPSSWDGRVDVTLGEITDADAIDATVAGSGAVISALGPSMDRKATGLPLVEGTQRIIDAMHRHDLRRYIGHATPSILDPQETPTRPASSGSSAADSCRAPITSSSV